MSTDHCCGPGIEHEQGDDSEDSKSDDYDGKEEIDSQRQILLPEGESKSLGEVI